MSLFNIILKGQTCSWPHQRITNRQTDTSSSYFFTQTYLVGAILEEPHQGTCNEYLKYVSVMKKTNKKNNIILCSLIRIFTVCILAGQSCKFSLCGQQRVWSDYTDVQRVHIVVTESKPRNSIFCQNDFCSAGIPAIQRVFCQILVPLGQ